MKKVQCKCGSRENEVIFVRRSTLLNDIFNTDSGCVFYSDGKPAPYGRENIYGRYSGSPFSTSQKGFYAVVDCFKCSCYTCGNVWVQPNVNPIKESKKKIEEPKKTSFTIRLVKAIFNIK